MRTRIRAALAVLRGRPVIYGTTWQAPALTGLTATPGLLIVESTFTI